MCPHATILIQPYGNFTKKEIEKVIPKLKEELDRWAYGAWTFEILDSKPFPTNRAIDILREQKKYKLKNDEVLMGLTHEDIKADVHNVKNYGIVGLAFLRGYVCVVSDKRLKDKSQIWKPMIHEFMHAFFASPHCPNDDPTCYMKDAKGKGNFGIQDKMCDSCKRW